MDAHLAATASVSPCCDDAGRRGDVFISAGVAAGALQADAPLEVMQVHYASVEPLLVFSTTLVMASSWWLLRRGTLAAAALAGVATGLAAGSKYPGVAFGSAVAWAIVERWWQERSRPPAAAPRRTAVAGLAMASPRRVPVVLPPCRRADGLARPPSHDGGVRGLGACSFRRPDGGNGRTSEVVVAALRHGRRSLTAASAPRCGTAHKDRPRSRR
jgi:hypothetical protein